MSLAYKRPTPQEPVRYLRMILVNTEHTLGHHLSPQDEWDGTREQLIALLDYVREALHATDNTGHTHEL